MLRGRLPELSLCLSARIVCAYTRNTYCACNFHILHVTPDVKIHPRNQENPSNVTRPSSRLRGVGSGDETSADSTAVDCIQCPRKVCHVSLSYLLCLEPSLVPRLSTTRGKERLITLLDFLGPSTFPSSEFELANQIAAFLIQPRALPLQRQFICGNGNLAI